MESFELMDFTLCELLFVIVTGYIVSRCCEQIVDSILTKLYEEERRCGAQRTHQSTRATALALNPKP
jgi:hypothetical protein